MSDDLPMPQNAAGATSGTAEAARFPECWDAVLSYADLCTAGSAAAARLATEAFTRGLREARGATAARTASGPGRRPVRLLPPVPLLLTAVRTTAASWEATGQGDDLTPGLRRWLRSDRAARYTGPPAGRPLALRALRDMQLPDAELLWLAEVEALPLPVVARRLGLDPAATTGELAQARDIFRDRCRRDHLDGPADETCRDHAARLLDTADTGTSEELSRHRAGCADCAEAAGCLRTDPGSLPAALADGVIGWGGLAYLERRRRAAEVRLAAVRPAPADDDGAIPGGRGARRARAVRGGLLGTAALISLLALTASLRPFGDPAASSGAPSAAPSATAGRQPVPDPPAGSSSAPPPRPAPAGSESPTATPSAPATATATLRRNPAPQGTATAAPAPPTATPALDDATGAPSPCQVHYDLVNQWPAGFQATVTVTTARALDTWRVSWTFADGQRITQMWDATHTPTGPRVTATAAPYNATVPAGGTLSFGFLATWEGSNTVPEHFTLNGRGCSAT
ncbi:hypothetical protein SUDANB145_01339 [Streptomyces sp. enrichment culture]|uniref:cellulose binding domain-containing protein n=1 Tax=Streptomyces sp. enrichment culture TaxID=1795815 RepID=UPI003F571F29